jgi:hypothetical protein
MKPLLQWKSNEYYTIQVCVIVVLDIQHAMSMGLFVMCPALLYEHFPHFQINGTYYGKKSLNIKCVFWFSLHFLSEIFLIQRRTERDIINIYWSSCKIPVILVGFEWQFSYLDRFSKNTQIPNYLTIRLVEAELSHADGRRDRYDKTNSRFSKLFERVWKIYFPRVKRLDVALNI